MRRRPVIAALTVVGLAIAAGAVVALVSQPSSSSKTVSPFEQARAQTVRACRLFYRVAPESSHDQTSAGIQTARTAARAAGTAGTDVFDALTAALQNGVFVGPSITTRARDRIVAECEALGASEPHGLPDAPTDPELCRNFEELARLDHDFTGRVVGLASEAQRALRAASSQAAAERAVDDYLDGLNTWIQDAHASVIPAIIRVRDSAPAASFRDVAAIVDANIHALRIIATIEDLDQLLALGDRSAPVVRAIFEPTVDAQTRLATLARDRCGTSIDGATSVLS